MSTPSPRSEPRRAGPADARWNRDVARGPGHWQGPVLLVHTDGVLRQQAARRIHAQRPTRGGTFRHLDCRELVHAGRVMPAWHELWSDHHGTLYLDHLEALPQPLQLQLLAWLDRQVEQARSPAWPSPRLVAGVHAAPGTPSRSLPVVPALLDTLDKLRVDLEKEVGRDH
jgi:hypothetical protein